MLTTPSTETSPSAALVVRVLVVDDHPLFRAAIREFLARDPVLEVVAEAGSLAEATERLAHHTFDVAIVDLVLPDGRGFAFVNRLVTAQPDCKVLALSGVDDPTQMAAMLRSGASGYVLKTQPVDEIIEALRRVLRGARSVPAASRDQIDMLLDNPDAWPLERLTPREREIFDLLVAGHANKDIARKLFISTRTVETHRFRMMQKLSVRSLTQLARRHGLLG
jgi:DNA-binding NarL/FixJ family response regulator